MNITPTGSPAWVRNASHDIYGGNTEKTNFHSQGVTNGQTDVGAEAFVRFCADLAAVVRTCAFSSIVVTCNDSSPAAPTISVVHQMTGVRLVSYVGDAAPTGFPSGARNGNGDVTITWATSYNDPYSVAGSVDIQHADLGILGTAAVSGVVSLSDPNVDGLNEAVRVKCFNFPAGTAKSDASFSLSVG